MRQLCSERSANRPAFDSRNRNPLIHPDPATEKVLQALRPTHFLTRPEYMVMTTPQ